MGCVEREVMQAQELTQNRRGEKWKQQLDLTNDDWECSLFLHLTTTSGSSHELINAGLSLELVEFSKVRRSKYL